MALIGNGKNVDEFQKGVFEDGLLQNMGWAAEVRLGRVKGVTSIAIIGHNEAITTVNKVMVDNPSSIDITFMATAKEITISSGNANDTGAGTGANVVRVFGLDTAGDQIFTDVVLAGLTPVDLGTTYSAVNSMLCLVAGSTGFNAGTLFITDVDDTHTSGVPDTRIHHIMKPEWCLSTTPMFTVPRNHTLLPIVFSISTDADTNKPLVLTAKVRLSGVLTEIILNRFFFTTSSTNFDLPSLPDFEGMATYRLSAQTDTGTNRCSHFLQCYLVDNSIVR